MAELVPDAGQPPAPRISILAHLPNQQILLLMILEAAAIALVAGTWMWAQTPDYRVLYANVADRDGGAIIAAIEQMNVPYRFSDGGGAILVPAEKVHEVRLRLAGQGLPRGGLNGFELLENVKLGTSQFIEQVNYQRALEGELARSIQSLAAVKAARVHLALARQSVFVREERKPSASVLLNLYPGRTLEPAQVNAVVHLVASSIPDLPTKNVTVIDQLGHLLSAPAANAAGGATLDAGQLKYVQELEQSYAKRIEAIVSPIVGAGNVRAEVAADVDFSRIERAEELYKPNATAADATVRSQQTSESTSTAAAAASGVPGALSNQPPAAATPSTGAGRNAASTAPAAAPIAPQPINGRKDTTVNYEVDKTVRHVRQPVGGVRRLSVAVVVNQRKETDAAGKTAYKPLSQAEMTQITDLVKEAMGYSKERGDTLNVVNSAFSAAPPETVPETPLWKKPETYQILKDGGKQLVFVLALVYLVFGVLRPLYRRLLASRALQAAPEQSDIPAPPPPRIRSRAGHEEQLQIAKQLAQQEPKLVANVVKEWMATDER
jgi:flagellar M-ring protein FliF